MKRQHHWCTSTVHNNNDDDSDDDNDEETNQLISAFKKYRFTPTTTSNTTNNEQVENHDTMMMITDESSPILPPPPHEATNSENNEKSNMLKKFKIFNFDLQKRFFATHEHHHCHHHHHRTIALCPSHHFPTFSTQPNSPTNPVKRSLKNLRFTLQNISFLSSSSSSSSSPTPSIHQPNSYRSGEIEKRKMDFNFRLEIRAKNEYTDCLTPMHRQPVAKFRIVSQKSDLPNSNSNITDSENLSSKFPPPPPILSSFGTIVNDEKCENSENGNEKFSFQVPLYYDHLVVVNNDDNDNDNSISSGRRNSTVVRESGFLQGRIDLLNHVLPFRHWRNFRWRVQVLLQTTTTTTTTTGSCDRDFDDDENCCCSIDNHDHLIDDDDDDDWIEFEFPYDFLNEQEQWFYHQQQQNLQQNSNQNSNQNLQNSQNQMLVMMVQQKQQQQKQHEEVSSLYDDENVHVQFMNELSLLSLLSLFNDKRSVMVRYAMPRIKRDFAHFDLLTHFACRDELEHVIQLWTVLVGDDASRSSNNNYHCCSIVLSLLHQMGEMIYWCNQMGAFNVLQFLLSKKSWFMNVMSMMSGSNHYHFHHVHHVQQLQQQQQQNVDVVNGHFRFVLPIEIDDPSRLIPDYDDASDNSRSGGKVGDHHPSSSSSSGSRSLKHFYLSKRNRTCIVRCKYVVPNRQILRVCLLPHVGLVYHHHHHQYMTVNQTPCSVQVVPVCDNGCGATLSSSSSLLLLSQQPKQQNCCDCCRCCTSLYHLQFSHENFRGQFTVQLFDTVLGEVLAESEPVTVFDTMSIQSLLWTDEQMKQQIRMKQQQQQQQQQQQKKQSNFQKYFLNPRKEKTS